MAVRGFFYNATNPNDTERTYNGEDMNQDKAPFYKEGVAYGHLQVTADGGSMEVKVDGGPKTGYAYINMHTIHNTSVLTLTLEKASGTMPRIDRVIIRNDQAERRPSIFIKKGEFSKNPTPPELINNGEIQEKSLAQIYIKAGAVEITQADITDERADETVCGFIASQFQDIDFGQLSAQFNAWFAKEKASMETDHADFVEEYAEMTQAFMNEQSTEWNKWFKEKQNDLSGDIANNIYHQISVERARIDNIVALKKGSTTGDAELQDIRVGANGKTYITAGEAVRHQLEYLGMTDDIFKTIATTKSEVTQGKAYTFDSDLQIGDICSPSVSNKDGYFIYSAEVKKNDVIKINGEFYYYGDSINYYIVVENETGHVQQIIKMRDIHMSNNAEITITTDGILYISTSLDNFSNEMMFTLTRETDIGARIRPLVLDAENAETYLTDASYGDEVLNAILRGRQILVRTPNADGGNYTAVYSPIYMYQLPNYENKYLYLFYLKDEKQTLDLSALGIGTIQLPVYGELKMLLSETYNETPLI